MVFEYATAVPYGNAPWDLEPEAYESAVAHVATCDEGCRLYRRPVGTDEWFEAPMPPAQDQRQEKP